MNRELRRIIAFCILCLLFGYAVGVEFTKYKSIKIKDSLKNEIIKADENALKAEGKFELVEKMYNNGCRDDLRLVFSEHLNSSHHYTYEPKPIREKKKK